MPSPTLRVLSAPPTRVNSFPRSPVGMPSQTLRVASARPTLVITLSAHSALATPAPRRAPSYFFLDCFSARSQSSPGPPERLLTGWEEKTLNLTQLDVAHRWQWAERPHTPTLARVSSACKKAGSPAKWTLPGRPAMSFWLALISCGRRLTARTNGRRSSRSAAPRSFPATCSTSGWFECRGNAAIVPHDTLALKFCVGQMEHVRLGLYRHRPRQQPRRI